MSQAAVTSPDRGMEGNVEIIALVVSERLAFETEICWRLKKSPSPGLHLHMLAFIENLLLSLPSLLSCTAKIRSAESLSRSLDRCWFRSAVAAELRAKEVWSEIPSA